MERTTEPDSSRHQESTRDKADGRKECQREHLGSITDLQRHLGNQGVQELHERGNLQAKLSVGEQHDPAERAVERVADEELGPRATDGAPELQRSADVGEGEPISGDRERGLRSSLTGGQPLPLSTQSFFESRFGRDFSDVRVHTGADADGAARSINAEAFTVGSHVVFAKGNYQPGTGSGRKLLAHELTHVVQQGQAKPLRKVTSTAESDLSPDRRSAEETERPASNSLSRDSDEHPPPGVGNDSVHVQPKLAVSSPDEPAEREAERVAEAVLQMNCGGPSDSETADLPARRNRHTPADTRVEVTPKRQDAVLRQSARGGQVRSRLIEGENYNVDLHHQGSPGHPMAAIDVEGDFEERLREFNLAKLAVNVITSGNGTVTWYFIDLEQRSGVAVTEAEVDAATTQLLSQLDAEGSLEAEFLEHIENKIQAGDEFVLAAEYSLWAQGINETADEEAADSVTVPEDAEVHEVDFDLHSEMAWAEAIQSVIPLPMRMYAEAARQVAMRNGITIADGLSASAGFISGLSLGGGIAFFPSGKIGLFGSFEFSGGAQAEAGVSGDRIYVLGGVEKFGGTTYTVSGGYDFGVGVEVTLIFEDPDLEYFLGIAGSLGIGVGADLLSRGAESVEVL